MTVVTTPTEEMIRYTASVLRQILTMEGSCPNCDAPIDTPHTPACLAWKAMREGPA